MAGLTHIRQDGSPGMVDVGEKNITRRCATAEARVLLPQAVQNAIENGDIASKKGPVFHTAIIAGTQGVKKTSDLIPFCHPLAIEKCDITIRHEGAQLIITCTVAITGKTGVEMEALTGATIAALTTYDMCKALSHDMVIDDIRLIAKTGGKSDIGGGA